MIDRPSSNQSAVPAFLRDVRILQALGQIVFVIAVVAVASLLVSAIFSSLAAKNLAPTFSFLNNRSGFDISNAPPWYSNDSSYWTAFQVGMTNTIRVVVAGLILTTLLGVLMGVLLLSSNWLIRHLARAYVELLRNTPLLVQLFVWYFIVMLTLLPQPTQPATFPNEGVALIPLRLAIYVIAFVILQRWSGRQKSTSPFRSATISGFFACVIAIEIGFWLSNTQAAWSTAYASGNLGNGVFLLYILISILLLAACWFAPTIVRWPILGTAVGQLVGGLLFYFGIIPNAALRQEFYPLAYMSKRGFVFPEIVATGRFTSWITFVAIGLALAIMMWMHFGQITETTGRQIRRGLYAFLAVIGFAILGWILVQSQPAPASIPITQADGTTAYMSIEDARSQSLLTEAAEQVYSQQPLLVILPRQKINKAGIVLNNFERGTEIQPEYMALLLGLVVYTSAFIAEIVRAGIQAVPRGQMEASRALGLSTTQTLRMVVLPQALRVIVPPLGNQYLNLSKNSSLAVAIAYADVVLVTQTIMNQSGQSVTGITMLMVFYLIISLMISLFTNWFNRRFKLVTR